MIDDKGFRLNVGIIVCNADNQLLWCRRFGKAGAWQFPQGGIHDAESPKEAMYRELLEELGLAPSDVACLGESAQWLSYVLPEAYRRHRSKPLCIGQKQKWFLLRLLSEDSAIRLDVAAEQEFDQWQWVSYWTPMTQVIAFKREVYQQILDEFSSILGVARQS